MPRVSILMPCRDALPHLAAAIESIDAQTYSDYEVVAVDDGSSDDTPQQLAAWAARDRRVRVARQGPHGIVAALMRACDLAAGEILVRMDADDIAHPHRIARQVELLDSDPRVGACGTLVQYFPREDLRGGALRYERWINSLAEHDDIVRDLFVECPIAHPTLAVRRSALDNAGGYQDNGWPEDYDLILRLWRTGMRFDKVSDAMLLWRESAGRASRIEQRYSPASFRRCKVHYLKQTLLAGRDGAVLCGAGPVGKAFARELLRQDVPVLAFVELDPRKVGQEIHGARVIAPGELHRFAGALVLGAVGQPGARREIRRTVAAAGFVEGLDFVAVA